MDYLMDIEEVMENGRGTARSYSVENIFLEEAMELSSVRLRDERISVICNANGEKSSLVDTPLTSWVEMSMVL
jgi:hypothetical protein